MDDCSKLRCHFQCQSNICCPMAAAPFRLAAAPFRRLHAKFNIRRKHHLHRKAHILPCELSNAYALLISRSDTQCFSHEDGCFAPVTKCKRSPSELLQDLLHGNGSRLRDKFSSIEYQLVPLFEAGIPARGDDPALALYHDYICLAGNVEVANPPAYVGMLTF